MAGSCRFDKDDSIESDGMIIAFIKKAQYMHDNRYI